MANTNPTAVIAVESSKNSKTGEVSATYATQASCPTTCSFKNAGCYAESGRSAFTTRRLNGSMATDTTEIAEIEASLIRGLSGSRPLRVHVVGDSATDAAASIVSSAMSDYEAKAGQPAWTYTPAWRSVQRSSWHTDRVLASCESTADVRTAWERGYSAAIVVADHQSDKSYELDGLRVIPCPQQTGRAANCRDCGLCLNGSVASRIGKAVIGFSVHGAGAKKAKAAIS